MRPRTLKRRTGPEAIIQTAIVKKLRMLQWFVVETHGNEFQQGLPDLYCCHASYGARWVEVKNPLSYKFTPAQLKVFPAFSANGIGVWILISDLDQEIRKLHGPPNWYTYLK